MGNPVAAGARFVLLNGAVVPAGLTAFDIGRDITWRWGPASRDAADPAYAENTHSFNGTGLRPLSPVHVRGQRGTGGVDISWVRRTRLSGDSWAQVEVPLGEDIEAYEVDILSGDGAVIRTLEANAPEAFYSDDQMISDFGWIPSVISVRVYQMSSVYGRGSVRESTLYV